MRILHIINGEFYSGAERVQDILALNLPRHGYDVHFACVKPDKFEKYCESPKEKIHNFSMASRVDISKVHDLTNMAKKLDIKIIHTHTPRSAMVGALVASFIKVPRIHHLHSPTVCDTEDIFRNIINTSIERIFVCGTQYFIAVSNAISYWISRLGISSEKIFVVPNGVPFSITSRAYKESAPVVVGAVALFRHRKGLDLLMQALRLALDQGHDIILRVVGGFESPQYESKIKRLAEELDLSQRIQWRGFQRDVSSELFEMDIFALPSRYGEGMPMVVLEAMATGLPILAANVQGISEVVRNGSEGLIVDTDDVFALSKGLMYLSSMPEQRTQFGISAKQRHAHYYSGNVMASRVAEIYRLCLG